MTMHTMTDSDDNEFEPASPDKLYAHHCRQLSAMLDGELAPDQAKFMLRRLGHDTELAACWERWQVCGDAMRGQRNTLLPVDFAQRVSAAIAGGDGRTAVQAAPAPRSRLARWGGGAALAASVAVCALLVARQIPWTSSPAMQPSDVVAASSSTAASPSTPTADFSTVLAASRGTVGQAPAGGDAGSAAAALATAVAVAEVPRRAGERRSRGQSPRAARRMQARQAEAAQPVPVLVASSVPLQVPVAQDPFAAAPLQVAPSRPWPRAVLPGLASGGGFAAGYDGQETASGFDPFRPRLQGMAAAPGGGIAPVPSGDVDGSENAPH